MDLVWLLRLAAVWGCGLLCGVAVLVEGENIDCNRCEVLIDQMRSTCGTYFTLDRFCAHGLAFRTTLGDDQGAVCEEFVGTVTRILGGEFAVCDNLDRVFSRTKYKICHHEDINCFADLLTSAADWTPRPRKERKQARWAGGIPSIDQVRGVFG